MIKSLWSMGTERLHFPALERDLHTDVLIVGGGMAGILCAKMLEQQGVEYTLIERGRIGGGITENTTAKITSQHGGIYGKLYRQFGKETARAYWEANEAALSTFRRMAGAIDCDFRDMDHHLYALDSTEKLDQEMEALQRVGIPFDFVQTLPLPLKTAGAIRFRNQAQFHPMKFLMQLSRGMHIYENTPALEFVEKGIRTPGGIIRADKTVVATHFPMLNKHGAYFLKMYQHRSHVLALENAQNVNGMYLDISGKGLSLRNQGDLLLIGGGAHRTGKKSRGWTELEAFAQAKYPDAREVCRWATQDCMTLDGMPYIGQYSPSTPNLYVATGFNKWGMTSSMAAATILKDLLQGKENEFAFCFSPRRTMLRPQLFLNGLESAAGFLTPAKPRCPHMGCGLKWNPWEHSWDCSCHGSRFSKEGKLLNNPATGDLRRK